MGTSGRGARHRTGEWRLAVAAAVALVLAVAGYAGYDVYQQVAQPDVASVSTDVSGGTASDSRRQVLLEVTVTSDGPFAFAYRDADGESAQELSEDGRPVTVELVRRGAGPYLQVWAETSPTASFVRCEIAVNNERKARETVEGPAARTYCVA